MVSNTARFLLVVALSTYLITIVGCGNNMPSPVPTASSSQADEKNPATANSTEPVVPGPRGVIWEIGKADGESGFDTDPHDDPEVVEYTIGDPENKFPEGLGTDIGNQRSKIRIHFTGPIPTGTKLYVRWSPGGSEAVDQFKVELDGKPLGESPALQGVQPEKLHTEDFAAPASNAKDHVLVFLHPQGDGLGLRHIRLETE